ncbi:hypothetical protein [Dyella subtropica]|uniref:hypothetical protein n=1 Tax=Dyella subtropica TaxID=2992127 RepID=UPI002250112D|nr:hypothetical protein [Dyella subtropica]
MSSNEAILANVEARGGVYVWETEVFTVAFMANVAITDADVLPLVELRGVQQIALNAAELFLSAVAKVAGTPGLQSLVLFNSSYSELELASLRAIGPEIMLA